MIKKIGIGFVILISGLLTWNCVGVPNFDDTPSITFNKNTLFPNIFNDLSVSYIDSLIVSVDFQDGDGDLGYDANEAGTGNYIGDRYYNYHIDVYRQRNSPPTLVTLATTYNGNFPKLTDSGKSRPIKGTIDYSLTFPHNGVTFLPNDTLLFEIYIYDNAGHKSNVIRTDKVVIIK